MFAATDVPGPGTYLAGFAVSAALGLLGVLLAGRVNPRTGP